MNFSDRTYIMGILNFTPDSFSDGGKFNNMDAALKRAEGMLAQGADIIDVGGESTRPNADFVSAQEEMERVIPLIEKLAANFDAKISVDTYKGDVAREALKAGATMLNDVWGLKYDDKMAAVAAEFKVPIVIMHNQESKEYKKFLEDVVSSLEKSIDIALAAGIDKENIILDPGFGFAKDTMQNLYLLNNLHVLKKLNYPILVGTSRKSMIGNTLGLPVDQRMEGTAATVAIAISKGANIVRVHDVKEMKRVALMTDAIIRSELEECNNG